MQIWEVESPLLSEQANGTVPTQWSVVRVFLEMLCGCCGTATGNGCECCFSSFSFLLLSVWKTKSTNISRMFYLEISQPSLGVLHAASQGSPMTRLANAARDGTQV